MSTLQRPTDFFTVDEIAGLRTLSNWRSTWSLVHCWGVIAATWIAVSLWTNPLTICVAILIIGARHDRLRNTRTVEAAWWERALIAPYGVNYGVAVPMAVA
jgi:hypothetical protein